MDYFLPNKERTNSAFVALVNLQGLVASDLNRAFPVTSHSGNKYIMLWYDYNSNTLQSIPLKSKSAEEQTEAYNTAYEFYVSKGFRPKVHKMDNEASKQYLTNLEDKKVKYQLVPPHMYRQNPAEQAIRMWKERFMLVAATYDSQFPVYEWCKLLEGVDLQLNLLCGSCFHLQISAECHLNGEFNYHASPLAPLGTKTTVFVPTHNRKTWEFHCMEEFYLVPARHHYCCHRNYITETRGE